MDRSQGKRPIKSQPAPSPREPRSPDPSSSSCHRRFVYLPAGSQSDVHRLHLVPGIDKCIVLCLAFTALSGLKQCRWDGRNQRIHKKGITYYLDGAHTLESVQVNNVLSSQIVDKIFSWIKIRMWHISGESSSRPEYLCTCISFISAMHRVVQESISWGIKRARVIREVLVHLYLNFMLKMQLLYLG